jgi:predicted GH43/DUF377 family glycosyl hydrolase
MSAADAERRRYPRIPVDAAPPVITLPMSATVQVLDISETGVLLASSQPLGIGRRANLKVRLGAEPLALQVEVKRVLPNINNTRTAYRMGAAFVDLDDTTKKKLETFLRAQT